MAKLSARGTHKVAGFRVSVDDNLGSNPEHVTWYWKYALRSDGAVLRALARRVHGQHGWTAGGNYTVIGTFKVGAAATVDDLRRYVERKHAGAEITKAAA